MNSSHADYHVNTPGAETRTRTPLHVDKLTVDTSLLAFCKLRNLTSIPALPEQGFRYWLFAIRGRFFLSKIYWLFFSGQMHLKMFILF